MNIIDDILTTKKLTETSYLMTLAWMNIIDDALMTMEFTEITYLMTVTISLSWYLYSTVGFDVQLISHL